MTGDDWVKIIGAIASGLVLIIASISALWFKVRDYQRDVNGRMDQLLELTRRSAQAEGRLSRGRPTTPSMPPELRPNM